MRPELVVVLALKDLAAHASDPLNSARALHSRILDTPGGVVSARASLERRARAHCRAPGARLGATSQLSSRRTIPPHSEFRYPRARTPRMLPLADGVVAATDLVADWDDNRRSRPTYPGRCLRPGIGQSSSRRRDLWLWTSASPRPSRRFGGRHDSAGRSSTAGESSGTLASSNGRKAWAASATSC
jgi:hypothetical protein